jgi:hypothetical protein
MQPRIHSRSFLTPLLLAALLSNPSLGAEPEGSKPALPISELILYSSGVGYYQRDGHVEGKAFVELQFKVDDINDLLKSMVVQDLDGGQVSAVTYGSRDPLTRTLKSFGIDLTSNPSLGQLLSQLRGQQVEVLLPGPRTGTIVGVEKRIEQLEDKKTIEREYLNLLTPEGLQSLPLSQVQAIRILNERLNSELQQALQVLSTSQDTQKKTVAIALEGQGKRRVSVAYIAQTPVWKTSYRLVLDDKDKPYLQGWAIVENTSDDDWKEVKLSLVSGRPISFTMDLYQPLYTTRPVVRPELYASLRPQVYGASMDADRLVSDEERLQAARAGDLAAGRSFGVGQANIAPPASAAPRSMTLARGAVVQPDEKVRSDLFVHYRGVGEPAQGTQAGELFQYRIKDPVSLARQKSAMLPIVSQNVEGAKVSIYNEQVQGKHPLYGFRLKNTTSLHLMQGPITVFDASAYAGDARMEDLAAGQERLISYGLDIKTEVEPQVKAGPQELSAVSIRKGTLLVTRKTSEEKTYLVRNRDEKNKAVLIEHPFRSDWELVEPKDPSERTREFYRFNVAVSPGKTANLTVREQRLLSEHLGLVNTGPDVISYYLQARQVSQKVKTALEKVVSLRDASSQTSDEINRREKRVNEITQEQSRIRENMTRLNQSSELYSRYVKTLDRQETELEELRQEIKRLMETSDRQQRELHDYLLNLEVE